MRARRHARALDLHVVDALAVARPDVEQRVRERLAARVADAAAVEGRLAAHARRDVGAQRQLGRAVPIVGALHGGLGGLGRGQRLAVPAGARGGAQLVEHHHHHRGAQRVRQQDELLAPVVAGLADGGEELDAGHPFVGLQVDLADEGMQVLDQRLHDAREARVGRAVQALQRGPGQFVGVRWGHGACLRSFLLGWECVSAAAGVGVWVRRSPRCRRPAPAAP